MKDQDTTGREFPKGDHSQVKFETPNGIVRANGGQTSDSSIDRAMRKLPDGQVPWGFPNGKPVT